MKKIGLYLGCEPFSGGMFQYSRCMLDAVIDLPKEEFEVLVAYSSGAWESHLVTQAVTFTHFPRTFFDRATASAWRRLHRRELYLLEPHQIPSTDSPRKGYAAKVG